MVQPFATVLLLLSGVSAVLSWSTNTKLHISRRDVLWNGLAAPLLIPSIARAQEPSITDRIYLDIKSPTETNRIVIGLYGNDAPKATNILKQLVSNTGLPAACRPRAERTLQKEQLEANKVYNSCKESESDGVRLAYSTVWRIRKDERIDIGAVTGKFGYREYPVFDETNALRHARGSVSVRKGNTGGFGVTIVPTDSNVLDETNLVVGCVLEGMEYVQVLNETPVVASSSLNYMSLTGGPKSNDAPDKSCRYGGPMYCNENKPLVKLTVVGTGSL